MTPLYDYLCPDCGERTTEIRAMAERLDPPTCECGAEMELTVSQTNPPRVEGGTPRFHRRRS